MKRHRILAICAIGCGLFLSYVIPPVFARDDDLKSTEQFCKPPPYEAISTLYTPSFGVPAVWDAVYENGRDDNVRLVDAMPMVDGTVLVAGDGHRTDKAMPADFIITQLNMRGRTVMEKRYALKPQEETVAMLADEEGYIVVSHFGQGKEAADRMKLRISWYNKEGSFVKEKVIASFIDNYQAEGGLLSVDGKGFLVFIRAVTGEFPGNEYSKIFSFSRDGRLLWERSYRPGIPNVISHIFPVKDTGHYMASGTIRMDDGRMGGWLLELDEEGAVVWQRTYPRGLSAVLGSGQPLPNGHFVLTGISEPADGGPDAVWIMEISKTGEPIWQRYMRHDDLSLSAVGLDRNEDGRMILMLNAKAESKVVKEQEGRNHIRLLTLSPRGDIMQDEPYIDAVHAEGEKLMTGREGERIMLANIVELVKSGEGDTLPEGDMENKEPIERKLGWVVVATPLEPYTDICKDIDGQ